MPPTISSGAQITEVGGRLLHYSGGDQQGSQPDWLLDEDGDGWSAVPDDPFERAASRAIVTAAGRLVLLVHPGTAPDDSTTPGLIQAATLEQGGSSWRRLPGSKILRGYGPFVEGNRVYLAHAGFADGGTVNPYPQRYAYGGILDLAAQEWLPLPQPDGLEEHDSVGVLGPTTAAYVAPRGAIFHIASQQWLRLPAFPAGPHTTGITTIAAGRLLFAFGGVDWRTKPPAAEFTDDTWTWEPPSGR